MTSRKQQSKSQGKLADYWKEAKKYVKVRTTDTEYPPWVGLQLDEEEFKSWMAYFAWLGATPVGISYLRCGDINEFLVPCERPEDFDARYRKG